MLHLVPPLSVLVLCCFSSSSVLQSGLFRSSIYDNLSILLDAGLVPRLRPLRTAPVNIRVESVCGRTSPFSWGKTWGWRG